MTDSHFIENGFTHAWRYFELHAQQRMAVFNFFLVLSGLISAALSASIQGPPEHQAFAAALGVLLILVSFVFWKLDQRNSFLTKRAEAALSEIEKLIVHEQGRLFSTEPEATNKKRHSGKFLACHLTFGESFRVVFLVMALVGFSGAVISISRLVSHDTEAQKSQAPISPAMQP